MIEEVKKIIINNIQPFHTADQLIRIDVPRMASQICQLFPKTKDNPDGYELKPDEHQARMERIFKEIEKHISLTEKGELVIAIGEDSHLATRIYDWWKALKKRESIGRGGCPLREAMGKEK